MITVIPEVALIRVLGGTWTYAIIGVGTVIGLAATSYIANRLGWLTIRKG